MVALRMIPMIGVVAVIYTLVALAGADVPQRPFLTLTLPSGAAWTLSTGDLLLLLSVIGLYIEVLKATRTSQASIIDHVLSLAVFIACLLGFILVPSLGTSTFLLITSMSLFDVIAGFTVTINTARRDLSLSGGPV